MPLVQAANRAALGAMVYTATCVTAAIGFFVVLATIGTKLGWESPTVLGLLSLIAFLYALHHLGAIHLPLPSSRWQVPRDWAGLGQVRGAALYGGVMGLGFPTRVPFATYHVAIVATLLCADTGSAVVLGGAFGVGRAASLLLPRVLSGQYNSVSRTEFIYRRPEAVHMTSALILLVCAASAAAAVIAR